MYKWLIKFRLEANSGFDLNFFLISAKSWEYLKF